MKARVKPSAALLKVYYHLDLVPKGRDELELPWTMAWVRHHDRYGASGFVDAMGRWVAKDDANACCHGE